MKQHSEFPNWKEILFITCVMKTPWWCWLSLGVFGVAIEREAFAVPELVHFLFDFLILAFTVYCAIINKRGIWHQSGD